MILRPDWSSLRCYGFKTSRITFSSQLIASKATYSRTAEQRAEKLDLVGKIVDTLAWPLDECPPYPCQSPRSAVDCSYSLDCIEKSQLVTKALEIIWSDDLLD